MNKNAEYYSQNAASFFEATVSVDMSPLYEAFLSKLPTRAQVLDAGCGSGRDAKAFADRGHDVSAFDASAELARLASAHCGFEVAARTFSETSSKNLARFSNEQPYWSVRLLLKGLRNWCSR